MFKLKRKLDCNKNKNGSSIIIIPVVFKKIHLELKIVQLV